MSRGQQDVSSDRVRNLAAQSHRRSRERKKTPSHFGDAEARALAGDADVGGLQNFRTAGDRRTLDRGDERFRQSKSFQQRLDDARAETAGVALAKVVAGMHASHRLQIRARAKRAAG